MPVRRNRNARRRQARRHRGRGERRQASVGLHPILRDIVTPRVRGVGKFARRIEDHREWLAAGRDGGHRHRRDSPVLADAVLREGRPAGVRDIGGPSVRGDREAARAQARIGDVEQAHPTAGVVDHEAHDLFVGRVGGEGKSRERTRPTNARGATAAAAGQERSHGGAEPAHRTHSPLDPIPLHARPVSRMPSPHQPNMAPAQRPVAQ